MNRKRITATKLKIGIASAFMIFFSTLMSAQQQVSLPGKLLNRHFKIKQKLKSCFTGEKKPNTRLMKPEPVPFLRSVLRQV